MHKLTSYINIKDATANHSACQEKSKANICSARDFIYMCNCKHTSSNVTFTRQCQFLTQEIFFFFFLGKSSQIKCIFHNTHCFKEAEPVHNTHNAQQFRQGKKVSFKLATAESSWKWCDRVHEDEQLNLCGTGGEQGTGLLHAALFLWGLIM